MKERMEKGLKRSIVIIVVIGALLAWSPWLNGERAKAWATANFTASQKGMIDGCGVEDAVALKKELFGYRVHLMYNCGLIPNDVKPRHSKIVFVTAVRLVF